MNKRTRGCWLALIPAFSLAQQNPAVITAPPKETTKVYRLQYAFANHVADVLRPLGFTLTGDNGMHAVVIRGTDDKQSEAQRIIAELDQSGSGAEQRDAETTVYILAASNGGSSEPLPAGVEPVVRQLRSVFTYPNYQVLGTILMHSRDERETRTQGVLRNSADGQHKAFPYLLSYRTTVDVTRKTIHFDNFYFRLFIDPTDAHPAEFQTSLDTREGEKVVVGKSNIEDGSAAIFAVVTARIPNEGAVSRK